jgi:hypothetical protein
MTVNISNYTNAGLQRAEVSFFDNTDNIMIGSGTTLAQGADSPMLVVDGVNSYDLQPQAQRVVNTEGDDGVLGTFFFEPSELPSGNLVTGTFNSALAAQAQGSLVYSDGDFDVITYQPKDFINRRLMLVTTAQSQARDASSVGNPGFVITVWPSVQLRARGHSGGQTNATAGTYDHDIIANLVDKYPFGEAFSLSNEGTTQAVGYQYFSPNRVSYHAFVADGATTDFQLANTVAASDALKVQAWKDGVRQAYTTNYTAAGTTFTLAAAGSAGEKWSVRYQWI